MPSSACRRYSVAQGAGSLLLVADDVPVSELFSNDYLGEPSSANYHLRAWKLECDNYVGSGSGQSGYMRGGLPPGAGRRTGRGYYSRKNCVVYLGLPLNQAVTSDDGERDRIVADRFSQRLIAGGRRSLGSGSQSFAVCSQR